MGCGRPLARSSAPPALTVRSPLLGVFSAVPDGLLWRVESTDRRSGTHHLDRVEPSGFEHDAYPPTMEVRGIPTAHEVWANGTDCGYADPWSRGGVREGYFTGAALLSLVDHRLAATERSEDGFLRELLRPHAWRGIGTPEFLALLREYAGQRIDEAAARAILCNHG
jgi:hypothetical protein